MPPPKELRFSETTASVLLDAVRGIAAILVLLEHWRNAFFVDFPQIHVHRVPLSALYLLCAAGHQAVVIFFVLSGYLISGSVLRAFAREEWSWRQYLTHRLVRLWIVLIPALLLGACWDHLGIHLNLAPALYSGVNYNHMTANVTQALSWKDFLGNTLFLQTVVVPPLGSNGALWSLANEFWYYILFPLAACVIARVYRKPVGVAICGALFLTIAILVTRDILFAFPVWLLGVLLHAAPRWRTSKWTRCAATVVYAGVFFGIAIMGREGWRMPGAVSDLVLGIFTFLFLWVLLGAKEAAKPTVTSGIARGTARFSFTLYVAHTPILVFLVALLVHDSRWVPGMKSGSVALAVLAIVAAYAWVLASVTEFKTDRARAWAEARVMRRGVVVGRVV